MQEYVQRRKGTQRSEESRQEDREMQWNVKVQVEKDKQRAYDDLYAGWTARRQRLTYTGW